MCVVWNKAASLGRQYNDSCNGTSGLLNFRSNTNSLCSVMFMDTLECFTVLHTLTIELLQGVDQVI